MIITRRLILIHHLCAADNLWKVFDSWILKSLKSYLKFKKKINWNTEWKTSFGVLKATTSVLNQTTKTMGFWLPSAHKKPLKKCRKSRWFHHQIDAVNLMSPVFNTPRRAAPYTRCAYQQKKILKAKLRHFSSILNISCFSFVLFSALRRLQKKHLLNRRIASRACLSKFTYNIRDAQMTTQRRKNETQISCDVGNYQHHRPT